MRTAAQEVERTEGGGGYGRGRDLDGRLTRWE